MKLIIAPKAPNELRNVNLVGFFVVLFGVVGFVIWSLYTPLDSAVIAQGVIKVSSEKKKVQHYEGGIVKKILVKEGESVVKHQTLLLLDATFAGDEHQILSMQQQELEIRKALLISQRDGLATIDFTEDNAGLGSNGWIFSQKESAKKLFVLSKSALSNKLSVIDERIIQLKRKVAGTELEIVSKKEQISLIEEELVSWKKLIDKKYANKLRYLEIKGDLAGLKGKLTGQETLVASSESKINELRYEKIHIEKTFREEAANDLVDVYYLIKDLSKRINSARNVLDRIELKAPASGTVVGLNVFTVGAVIKAGETILEIVPVKDDLVISAKVMPIDVDKVSPSLNARIRISSYKQHEFPEFIGIVESVSADVFQDPKTLESYYTARIYIPKEILLELPKDKIHSGMPAQVMIVTGESSPAQYLIEPLLNAFRTAWRDS